MYDNDNKEFDERINKTKQRFNLLTSSWFNPLSSRVIFNGLIISKQMYAIQAFKPNTKKFNKLLTINNSMFKKWNNLPNGLANNALYSHANYNGFNILKFDAHGFKLFLNWFNKNKNSEIIGNILRYSKKSIWFNEWKSWFKDFCNKINLQWKSFWLMDGYKFYKESQNNSIDLWKVRSSGRWLNYGINLKYFSNWIHCKDPLILNIYRKIIWRTLGVRHFVNKWNYQGFCICDNVTDETIEHVFLDCPLYENIRESFSFIIEQLEIKHNLSDIWCENQLFKALGAIKENVSLSKENVNKLVKIIQIKQNLFITLNPNAVSDLFNLSFKIKFKIFSKKKTPFSFIISIAF